MRNCWCGVQESMYKDESSMLKQIGNIDIYLIDPCFDMMKLLIG